jgi:hypothetical protein
MVIERWVSWTFMSGAGRWALRGKFEEPAYSRLQGPCRADKAQRRELE